MHQNDSVPWKTLENGGCDEENYYNRFSYDDILDSSVYILEISEDHGKIHKVKCD